MTDDVERYADGWPVGPDDEIARAMAEAIGWEPEDFGRTAEWQRDDFRAYVRVARERLGAELAMAAQRESDARRAQIAPLREPRYQRALLQAIGHIEGSCTAGTWTMDELKSLFDRLAALSEEDDGHG